MPSPRWYLHGGVRATAVISLVGLVHPNIQMSFNRRVAGTLHWPLLTVASTIFRPSPEARYRSRRTLSCSWAKKLTASRERKATSYVLGVALAVDSRSRQLILILGCFRCDGEHDSEQDLPIAISCQSKVFYSYQGNKPAGADWAHLVVVCFTFQQSVDISLT